MDGDDRHEMRAGSLLFALLFLILSLSLLSQLTSEAKFSANGSLVAQPAFWPAVGVIGMSLFGILHLATVYRRGRLGADLKEACIWLRSLEYLIWFMAYVFAVPVIGYLPATLTFAIALALRAGYRNGRMIGASVLTGFGIVLIFKTLLAVKIPGGAFYEYLPAMLRNVMIINF